MKRFALVFALVLVLAVSASAMDFGKFTAEVPAGWSATKDGPTAIFTKEDNTASLSITVEETGGATAEQLAEAFAAEFKKSGFTDFTEIEKDNAGNLTFDMKNKAGVVSNCLITVEDDQFLLIVATGSDGNKDEMMKIIGSIKEK